MGTRRGCGSFENEANSLASKTYLQSLILQFFSSSERYKKVSEQSQKKKRVEEGGAKC